MTPPVAYCMPAQTIRTSQIPIAAHCTSQNKPRVPFFRRLPDAGPAPSRTTSVGRHPQPCARADIASSYRASMRQGSFHVLSNNGFSPLGVRVWFFQILKLGHDCNLIPVSYGPIRSITAMRAVVCLLSSSSLPPRVPPSCRKKDSIRPDASGSLNPRAPAVAENPDAPSMPAKALFARK